MLDLTILGLYLWTARKIRITSLRVVRRVRTTLASRTTMRFGGRPISGLGEPSREADAARTAPGDERALAKSQGTAICSRDEASRRRRSRGTSSEPQDDHRRSRRSARRPVAAKNMTAKQKAAHHHTGQDQEPLQSREENTGIFDSAQHSDAPGPFGTGRRTPSRKA